MSELKIHKACQSGKETDLVYVKKFMDKGGSPNKPNHFGETPIHIVCFFGHLEFLKVLLPKADFTIRDKHGNMPLDILCRNDRQDMLALLFEKIPVDVNYIFVQLYQRNYTKTIVFLIEKVSWHPKNFIDETELFNLIADENSDFSYVDSFGDSLLNIACIDRQHSIFYKLLKYGLDINFQGQLGRSCLHTAVYKNDLYMTRLLIDRGANLELLNENGNTPLFTACNVGHYELAEYLLKSGASPNSTTIAGYTIFNSVLTSRVINSISRDLWSEHKHNMRKLLYFHGVNLCKKNIRGVSNYFFVDFANRDRLDFLLIEDMVGYISIFRHLQLDIVIKILMAIFPFQKNMFRKLLHVLTGVKNGRLVIGRLAPESVMNLYLPVVEFMKFVKE